MIKCMCLINNRRLISISLLGSWKISINSDKCKEESEKMVIARIEPRDLML